MATDDVQKITNEIEARHSAEPPVTMTEETKKRKSDDDSEEEKNPNKKQKRDGEEEEEEEEESSESSDDEKERQCQHCDGIVEEPDHLTECQKCDKNCCGECTRLCKFCENVFCKECLIIINDGDDFACAKCCKRSENGKTILCEDCNIIWEKSELGIECLKCGTDLCFGCLSERLKEKGYELVKIEKT
jgi:hypothetical protein